METIPLTDANNPRLPLDLIVVLPGHNPRKKFNAQKLAELTESVRVKGVIQPIAVRPVTRPEGQRYAIIAGERRYRASVEAGLPDIPVIIHDVSEEEAEDLALIENSDRDDMSATAEADAATKTLARHDGDRTETARQLGWPMSKLNQRLALLNLRPEVKEALDDERIKLGHAELLATLAKDGDLQIKALATIEQHKLTVDKTRELLQKTTCDFSVAIFDTNGCASCQHNSNIQSDLFETSVEKGRCTNGICYKEKTKGKVEAIRAELAEEVPMVKVLETGDDNNGNLTVLSPDGKFGIGEKQYEEGCKACANFGATVSNIPGSEGAIERSICFDMLCNQKKVAEFIAATKKGPEKAETQSSSGGNAKTTGGTAKKTGADKEAATEIKFGTPLKDYRRKKVWEVAARNELAAQPDKALSFILDLAVSGHANYIDSLELGKRYAEITGNEKVDRFSTNLTPIHVLSREQKRDIFTASAVAAVAKLEDGHLHKLLAFLEADLGKHWRINEDFLKLLTKSELGVLSKQIGLDTNEASVKKGMAGKKDEAIAAILAAPFNFDGAVPGFIQIPH